ncbi:sigma-54-dependent Fis family transcriptional regulator [candidate division KSB1 bacterium]|nr:MAG: sigma-54-dependent Fis family transcriptional regulator [candidate division KSB1 bacterium]MBC6948873.1 sigma-54-dependent Fis family transcriptional regulator [candidate division KSB1 bacterium]MCE7944570.1 sigma-54-dependent Fis family transcriptional regulator [Chlorobi bacterium CHB1]MDL1874914.1 sigma-54-dependent Fis family transcriptional regulator [Cytophagia bacterium CHB2]
MILIIDDDFSVTASLALLLKQAGLAAQSAASPQEALQKLTHEKFDLILQDMNFSRRTSGEEGIALLKEIKQRQPHAPIILITAWGSIELAVKGMQAGASDFITKPWSNEQLLQAVKTALKLSAVSAEPAQTAITREALEAQHDFSNLVGRAPNFLRVLDLAGRVSATEASVLITGESGTGKELIAEAIHRNSERKDGPFIKVNLGGISATLFESEMFGHVKGAFTDARYDRKGRFELADGGTIFLDEIGDLDPSAQVKMLRVLQDRTYEPLGSSRSRTVDVRVISATNRNLAEMVSRGEFREDLLYRLNLIALHAPPLRERVEDIALLAQYFLQNLGKVYRRPNLSVSAKALHWLQQQPWPGNVRQLRHVIERTVLLHGKDTLDAADFMQAQAMQPATSDKDTLPAVGSMTLDDMEKAMIEKAMKHHDGNISKVAEALGLSRAALYRRFEKFGITP